MLYPVPAIDSFLEVSSEAQSILCNVGENCACGVAFSALPASTQIVCVPHDWRVTLAVIVIVNAAVSFILEVHFPDITPCVLHVTDLLYFSRKP